MPKYEIIKGECDSCNKYHVLLLYGEKLLCHKCYPAADWDFTKGYKSDTIEEDKCSDCGEYDCRCQDYNDTYRSHYG